VSIIDQIERSRAANAGRAVATVRDHAGLAKYEAAIRAIAEAKRVDEVKNIRGQAEAMRAAARVAGNRDGEIDMAEVRIRAERRLGELMADQRETVGFNKGTAITTRVDERPTLTEAGIDKHLADRARKYAAVPEKEFEGILAERRERYQQEDERVTVDLMNAGEKHVRGTFGTGENEWYTPAEFVERARAALGEIDLDPASSDAAQATVKAARHFTEADDGLSRDWDGRVWLNPPYAQPAISQFADKLCAEWMAENVEAAIVLTHNYTDTTWFQQIAYHARAICFTRGRVKFVSPAGDLAAPTQGQAFFYLGQEPKRFAEAFADVGFVVTLGVD
jgi:phage N-6-adenine-methyltransferase